MFAMHDSRACCTAKNARHSRASGDVLCGDGMSILIDKKTKVICQGITGSQGTFHTKQARAYGTEIVGGVTPGKGGTKHPDAELADVPLFDSVARGRRQDGRHRDVDLCAAAVRRRRDPRSHRRRSAADRLHHRRHSGDGHGPGETGARRLEIAPRRTELPRRC